MHVTIDEVYTMEEENLLLTFGDVNILSYKMVMVTLPCILQVLYTYWIVVLCVVVMCKVL